MNCRHLGMLLCVSILAGCVTVEPKDYSLFREEDPHSILIVPVVNNSVDVDAPEYFLSTVSKPVAERGYYVFPVHMVKRLMEDEGLADANMVHEADPTKLAALFDAESVLYITIEQWEAKYIVLATTVTVEFTYRLVDGESGEKLWQAERTLNYSPNSGSSSLIGLAVQAAVAAAERAKPSYIPLARQANTEAVMQRGAGLPAGPYHPDYQKDLGVFPVEEDKE